MNDLKQLQNEVAAVHSNMENALARLDDHLERTWGATQVQATIQSHESIKLVIDMPYNPADFYGTRDQINSTKNFLESRLREDGFSRTSAVIHKFVNRDIGIMRFKVTVRFPDGSN